MTSSTRGASTSSVEVTNVDRFGIWILVSDREYFLPHEEFPWFKQATLQQILNVELLHGAHLRWPDLDVDLCVDSLERPEDYPLVYR